MNEKVKTNAPAKSKKNSKIEKDTELDKVYSKRSKTSKAKESLKNDVNLNNKQIKFTNSDSLKIKKSPLKIISTIFNCGRKINLNNLSMNLLGYLSDFLGLPQILQLLNLNKRLRMLIVKKKIPMLIKYMEIRQNSITKKVAEFKKLSNNFKFEKLIEEMDDVKLQLSYEYFDIIDQNIKEMKNKQLSDSGISNVILQLLLLYFKEKETSTLKINSGIINLYYMMYFLVSQKCPFESVIFDFNENNSLNFELFVDSVSFILKADQTFKSIDMIGLENNNTSLLNIFLPIGSSTKIQTLSIFNKKHYIPTNNFIESNNIILFKNLEINTSIIKLDICYTMIWTSEMKIRFRFLLKNNKTIKHLILSPAYSLDENLKREVNSLNRMIFSLPGERTMNPNIRSRGRYDFDSDLDDSDSNEGGWCSDCGEYHDNGESDEVEEEEEKVNERLIKQVKELEEEKEAEKISIPNFDYLRENDSLEILEFRKPNLWKTGLESLVRGLSLLPFENQPENISKIHTLIFTINDAVSITHIGKIINSNSNIKTLEICCAYENINDFNIITLNGYLKNNYSLKTLILKRVKLMNIFAKDLIEVMKVNNSIEIVDLSNSISDKNTKIIKILTGDSRIIIQNNMQVYANI